MSIRVYICARIATAEIDKEEENPVTTKGPILPDAMNVPTGRNVECDMFGEMEPPYNKP
jgi:hypothetical protein